MSTTLYSFLLKDVMLLSCQIKPISIQCRIYSQRRGFLPCPKFLPVTVLRAFGATLPALPPYTLPPFAAALSAFVLFFLAATAAPPDALYV